jgi:hypothetical protein
MIGQGGSLAPGRAVGFEDRSKTNLCLYGSSFSSPHKQIQPQSKQRPSVAEFPLFSISLELRSLPDALPTVVHLRSDKITPPWENPGSSGQLIVPPRGFVLMSSISLIRAFLAIQTGIAGMD